MDIYYMHCNQMEAAHPSNRAVTLVTNVSHKNTLPNTTTLTVSRPVKAGGPSAWEVRERRECERERRLVLLSYELPIPAHASPVRQSFQDAIGVSIFLSLVLSLFLRTEPGLFLAIIFINTVVTSLVDGHKGQDRKARSQAA